MPAFILWANPSQVLPEGSVKGLYGVIKTEPSQKHIGGCRMKTVQRERRYVCGQTKQNAVYQEIEIYTVGLNNGLQQTDT